MHINPQWKILIVDDYKSMLKIVSSLLRQIGFENIEEANSGETAIKQLQKPALVRDKFRLIISDWNMDGMSGYELLKNVRSNKATRQIPFIMITSDLESDKFTAAKSLNVDAFIIKPFNVVTLQEKISHVLNNKQCANYLV